MPKLPVGRFGFSCPLFGLKRPLWLKAQSPPKAFFMRLVRRLTFIGGEGGIIPDVLCTSALCIYAAPTIALPRGQSNRRSHPTGRSQPRLRRATERVGLSPTLSGLCILASPSGSANARAVKLKFSSHQEVITSTASSNGEGGIRTHGGR